MQKRMVLLALLTATRLGWGQVTLADMVHRALARNPGFAMVAAEAKSAGEEVVQARSAKWPELDFSGSYRRQIMVPEMKIAPITLPFGAGTYSPFPYGSLTLGTLDNFDFRMTVSQPIFTGFRISQRLAAAEANLAAKNTTLSRQRAELINRVEKAYGQILKMQKYIEIAASGRDQIASHLLDVRKMVDQGLLKKEEVLKVQVRLSEAELALVQAQNGHAISRAVLENLLAENLAPETRFDDMPVTDAEETNLTAALQVALGHRPELKTLNYAQQANQALTRIVQGNRLPTVAAFGSLGYGKPGLDLLNKEWMDYWLVGIGVEWNLWNGGKTRSQIQQSKIQGTSLVDADRQLKDAITLEVTQAFLQMQEVKQRQQLCGVLLAQAEESYRVAEANYRQGLCTHTEYFDAQSSLTRAQLGKAQTEIDYRISLANLRHVQGLTESPYFEH